MCHVKGMSVQSGFIQGNANLMGVGKYSAEFCPIVFKADGVVSVRCLK